MQRYVFFFDYKQGFMYFFVTSIKKVYENHTVLRMIFIHFSIPGTFSCTYII